MRQRAILSSSNINRNTYGALYYVSDTSDVTLQGDGVITYSDESRCVFEILATRAPSRCGSNVRTDEVALAFLACPDGKETTEEFWDYVAWAVKRRQWTPRPLCPNEVQTIRDTGILPEVHAEMGFVGGHFQLCPQSMLPALMPVAARLQKELQLPIEWHHVFYALVTTTSPELLQKGSEDGLRMSFDTLGDILIEYVREHGHLPDLKMDSQASDDLDSVSDCDGKPLE